MRKQLVSGSDISIGMILASVENADIARALENRIWVIRADVAGHNDELMSYGSSEIVDPNGKIVRQARLHSVDLLVADIPTRRWQSRSLRTTIES